MSGVFKTIGKAAGGLFKTLFPKMPKPEKPRIPFLPDPESEAAKQATKKKLAERSAGGRAGTIYSAYGNQNLGGTS